MWAWVCMHPFRSMFEGQRTTLGVDPHLPPCLRQDTSCSPLHTLSWLAWGLLVISSVHFLCPRRGSVWWQMLELLCPTFVDLGEPNLSGFSGRGFTHWAISLVHNKILWGEFIRSIEQVIKQERLLENFQSDGKGKALVTADTVCKEEENEQVQKGGKELKKLRLTY